MKAEEFVKEVSASSLSDQRFEEKYRVFQKYQQLVMNTLREFHNVCENNNITYQIAYGSLLGAVRDGGQIPWDYDADVFVPAVERTKLIEVLRTKLSKDYYFYCIEEDSKCQHVIIRVAPKGYDTNFLHVDVFFVAGLPEDKEEAEKYKNRMIELTLQYKSKKFNYFNRGANSKKEALKMFAYGLKSFLKKSDKLWQEYLALSVNYPTTQSKLCCSADRFANDFDFPTSMLYETMLFETEIGQLRIPKDYKNILTLLFGDYQSVPPLTERMNEMDRHYDFLVKNCPLL